jgi:hypothetical protein
MLNELNVRAEPGILHAAEFVVVDDMLVTPDGTVRGRKISMRC